MGTSEGGKEIKNKPTEEGVMVLTINLFTNIPEGNHTIQNKEFKRSMIVLDKEVKNNVNKSETNLSFDMNTNLSQYPFISSKYKLKSAILYKNYEFIYRFFFSYNTFTRLLESYSKPSTEKSDEIIYHNIDVLLRALFPLFLKTSEGYHNSYKYMYERDGLSGFTNFGFNNIVETIKRTINVGNQKYTILNIGKDYTVKKIVWLNDFINNPNYNKLLANYIKFKNWLNDYAKNDIDNYNLIRTKTFATNRADFEKKKLKLGNRNYVDSDTNNPFFMKEIKDSAGKLNENYLNYSQFYDIIQYYNDNKTINVKLQQIIDGVFNINKPLHILNFEKFKNKILPKIIELNTALTENNKELYDIISKYEELDSKINNLGHSIKRGSIPIITVKDLIKKINQNWSQLNKINVIPKLLDNIKTILDNYKNDTFKTEFINKIYNNVKIFITNIGALRRDIAAYTTVIYELINKYNKLETGDEKPRIEEYKEDYNNNINPKQKTVINDIDDYNNEHTLLQNIITEYSENNEIIKYFKSYSNTKYNEQEKVEEFYDTMDYILKNKSNINNIDADFKKIIAFKTKKSIEQNKIYLPMIRIDVMMDFIDGKVNNDNYSQLQCKYMSNDLSNLILNKMYYKNEYEDYSFLKNNNYIYSIADNGIKQVNSRSKETPDIKKNEYKNNRYDNRYNSLIGGNHNRKSRNKKLNKKRKTKKNI